MSYLTAIRKECLHVCMNGRQPGNLREASRLVADCSSERCNLWVYRFGRGDDEADRTPLKSIRAFCTQCLGGSVYEPKSCTEAKCNLYRYREGHNPRLRGKGGTPPKPARQG